MTKKRGTRIGGTGTEKKEKEKKKTEDGNDEQQPKQVKRCGTGGTRQWSNNGVR